MHRLSSGNVRLIALKAGLIIFFCAAAMAFKGKTSSQYDFMLDQEDPWVAPSWADTLRNPLSGDSEASLRGKENFELYCWSCHGDKGRGDGAAGASFPVKPADFTKPTFMAQTDGAIFWKISTGRSNMPGYSGMLEKDAMWELVLYIRDLSKQP
jgi:mono/diheme cytochrome c family protein